MDTGSSLERDEGVENFDEPNQASRSPGSKYRPCTAQMENVSESTEHNRNSEESRFLPNDSKML